MFFNMAKMQKFEFDHFLTILEVFMEGGVSTMCPDDKWPCFGDNLSFEQERLQRTLCVHSSIFLDPNNIWI